MLLLRHAKASLQGRARLESQALCRYPHSSLRCSKGYAQSSEQYSLNESEEAALSKYCHKSLPKLAPPAHVHRFGIRLVMLEKARMFRESAVESDHSLLWVSKRSTLYPLLAHQGLFRASELAAMLSSDITFNRRSSGEAPVSVTFIIREAKTSDLLMNRGEQPITLDVRPDHPTYCPVSKTVEWLRMLRLLDANFQITKSGRCGLRVLTF